jgi:hypothetical protein
MNINTINPLSGAQLNGLAKLPSPMDIGRQLIADVKAGIGTADQLFDQVKSQLSPIQQGDLLRQLDQLPGARGLETALTGGSVIDDILSAGKTIVDAGKDIIAAGKGSLKWLQKQASDIKDKLASLPGEAANALADSMRGPSARKLTAGEITAIRQAYGNNIDLSNVRIVDGPGYNPDALAAFKIGGNPAITEGNTVYIEHNGFSKDFSTSPAGKELLVHEFSHVYQFQKMGFGSFGVKYAKDLISVRGDRNAAYDYRSRPNSTYKTETIEGQAQMVGDYAQYKAGDKSRTNDAQARDIERRLRGTGIYGF